MAEQQLKLQKAKRSQVYLKLGMAAPSGGGKTVGALMVAYGMMKKKYPDMTDEDRWAKIAIVDTENHSGELYANTIVAGVKIGEYCVVPIEPPFKVEKYIEAINLCEENGIEVCIIDSTTHAWSGEGGLLDVQAVAAAKSGNSYTAWKSVTPLHNQFVERMLQSKMHLIATIRSKTEYAQEKDEQTGKTRVKKLGLEPEQRKGMEYEFTIFFDTYEDHKTTPSKDRTNMFDGQMFRITPDTGAKIMEWLMSADTTEATVLATAKKLISPEEEMNSLKAEIIQICRDLGGQANEKLMKVVKKYAPNGNPNSLRELEPLQQLREELNTVPELSEELNTVPVSE